MICGACGEQRHLGPCVLGPPKEPWSNHTLFKVLRRDEDRTVWLRGWLMRVEPPEIEGGVLAWGQAAVASLVWCDFPYNCSSGHAHTIPLRAGESTGVTADNGPYWDPIWTAPIGSFVKLFQRHEKAEPKVPLEEGTFDEVLDRYVSLPGGIDDEDL